jgi:hypothetical protein
MFEACDGGTPLHRIFSGTTTAAEGIADAFGADVADLVAEVTDDKRLPKEERKKLQEDMPLSMPATCPPPSQNRCRWQDRPRGARMPAQWRGGARIKPGEPGEALYREARAAGDVCRTPRRGVAPRPAPLL